MKYQNNKKPFRERKTLSMKMVAVFGLVLKGNKILIIQDNPLRGKRRRWKDSESLFKLSGGTFFSKKEGERLLSRKIREETGISSIHLSIGREPFFVKKKKSHTIYFYLMKSVGGNLVLGKKIQFADFFSITEIEQKIKGGEFLEAHHLAIKAYIKTLTRG